jgi:hypothetical protein
LFCFFLFFFTFCYVVDITRVLCMQNTLWATELHMYILYFLLVWKYFTLFSSSVPSSPTSVYLYTIVRISIYISISWLNQCLFTKMRFLKCLYLLLVYITYFLSTWYNKK